MGIIRILLVADTHLGFDLPFRPRIKRRRRGPEFFANFERALKPALNAEVDAVVHGGDVLYRSKVPARLVEMAFAPLKRVAETGVPVYLVHGKIPPKAIAVFRVPNLRALAPETMNIDATLVDHMVYGKYWKKT